MNSRWNAALAGLCLTVALAGPATAGILRPYVRLDYGGNQLRMRDANSLISDYQSAIRTLGYPADFDKIGTAYGPSGAAGLWLFGGLRVGATFARQRAILQNRTHVPGSYFFEQDLNLSLREFGGEAALRFSRLAGLTLGGTVGRGRAEIVEGLSEEAPGYAEYIDATMKRTVPTYGAWIGFDQTNAHGGAGFIRAGFAYREIGHMPSTVTESDGVNSVTYTSSSRWADYSGYYVKVGMGYDLGH